MCRSRATTTACRITWWARCYTIADAILDRLMEQNHRLILTGQSLRQRQPKDNPKEKNTIPS